MYKYFIYCRKSTESEEKQALSIQAQLVELREYAKNNDLIVIKEFTETKTAKEPGRPVFNNMLEQIDDGIASGILAWNPDRLARNSIDGGRIIYLVDMKKIESLKFPTFWFEPTPQGKFMLSVAFGQAKYYTDNLRENILRGIRQKLRKGELPAKAPLGYINEPRLRTIEPNTKTFNKVKKCLEAFASGNYSLSGIRDKMFSLGLTNNNGNPLHLSTINSILRNPFYHGMFVYNKELYQGSHKPMVSRKLFDTIQEVLIENGRPRKKKNEFLFKNFARCGECGYCITADRKIKKSGKEYIYYFCTKKSKIQKCKQNHFLREENLEQQIKNYVQKVSLSNEWKNRYLSRIAEWEKQNNYSSELFVQNLRKELNEVKIKMNRLLDLHLDNLLETEEFKKKKNVLLEQKTELQRKLKDFEQKGNHWLEFLKNWVLASSQAKNLVSAIEMKEFIKKIGSNRRIKDQKLHIDFKKPWIYLYNLNAEQCAIGAREADYLLGWTPAESVCIINYRKQNKGRLK